MLVEVGGNGAIAFNDAARRNFTRTASDADFDAATDAALDEWLDGDTLRPSCALDVVDANVGDEMPLDAVGKLLGVTRERARQIEEAARARLTAPLAALTGKRPRD